METTIITSLITSIIWAIFYHFKLSGEKAKSENLTNDNRLKAEAIERHLKEKMELEITIDKEQDKAIEYFNIASKRKVQMEDLEKEVKELGYTIDVIVNDCDNLRAIITRKDETIKRYKAEIEKLNNPSKKKPYHFDESKVTKSKSKQQIAAEKKLRDGKGRFAK